MTDHEVKPGRYPGLPNEFYHGNIDAISATRLSWLRRSPAYCRWMIDHPTPPTDAMAFGTAVHSIILEPHEFDARYRLDPQCPEDRNPRGWHNTNDYKAAKADLIERDFALLTQRDFDACRRVRDNIYSQPSAARDLLEDMTSSEETYIAGEEGQTLRKCRPDLLAQESGTVVDVKTTKDARRFAQSVLTFNYHVSQAHYLDTMRAVDGPESWPVFLFLAVENTPPYEFAVYELDAAAAELGWNEMLRLRRLYEECQTSSEWPGYERDVQTLSLPGYAFTAATMI
jgi:hypothetical protein